MLPSAATGAVSQHDRNFVGASTLFLSLRFAADGDRVGVHCFLARIQMGQGNRREDGGSDRPFRRRCRQDGWTLAVQPAHRPLLERYRPAVGWPDLTLIAKYREGAHETRQLQLERQ